MAHTTNLCQDWFPLGLISDTDERENMTPSPFYITLHYDRHQPNWYHDLAQTTIKLNVIQRKSLFSLIQMVCHTKVYHGNQVVHFYYRHKKVLKASYAVWKIYYIFIDFIYYSFTVVNMVFCRTDIALFVFLPYMFRSFHHKTRNWRKKKIHSKMIGMILLESGAFI